MKKIKLPLPSFKKRKKGGDEDDQPKKKLSKKNLLIILVVLLLAAVAAKLTVFKDGLPSLPFGKGGGTTSQAEAKLPDPVDAYCLLDDSVASISSDFEAAGAADAAEGEEGGKEEKEEAAKGAEEVLLSMSTSYVPKAEGEEGEEAPAEEEVVEDGAILEANRPEGEYGYYYYRVGAGTEATISKYRAFLLANGF